MIITVTAPKKGLGQTTTTINIAAGLIKAISPVKKDIKVLVIDINKYCKDIEYYLSNTVATRGLDDYFSLYQADLITNDSLQTCLKKINENLSIIGSNEYFEITDEAMLDLLKRASEMFDFIVIDALGTGNITGIQKTLFEKSDKIVVTLNQTKSVMQIISNKNIYRNEMKKVNYVVNRNMDVTDTGIMDYSSDVIRQELEELGITSQLFPLNFDVEIMNEGNYGSVLSYVLGDKADKTEYNKQLKELLREILKDDPKYQDIIAKETKSKKGFLGFGR